AGAPGFGERDDMFGVDTGRFGDELVGLQFPGFGVHDAVGVLPATAFADFQIAGLGVQRHLAGGVAQHHHLAGGAFAVLGEFGAETVFGVVIVPVPEFLPAVAGHGDLGL